MAEEVFYHCLAIADGTHILQRECQPTVQQSSAHWGCCAVNDIIERRAILALSAQQLQVANREAVHPYELILFNATKMLNMTILQVLRSVEIVQDSTCCYHAFRQLLYAEALQVLHLKLLGQSIHRRIVSHHPVVQLKGEVFASKSRFKHLLLSAQIQYLFRRKVYQQFIDIIACALCNEELARRYIQEGNTHLAFAKVYTCQPGVLLLLQCSIRITHTRRNQLCHTTFHEFLSQFRVFQLVTDSHTQACAH